MELQQRRPRSRASVQETERQRTEILSASRKESREILTKANRDATAELREAESRGNRLTEQSRPPGHELTNSARAEVGRPRVGARPGRRHRPAWPAWRGAAPLGRRHGDAAIHEAVDAIVRGPRRRSRRSGARSSSPSCAPPVRPRRSRRSPSTSTIGSRGTVEPRTLARRAGEDEHETTEARGSHRGRRARAFVGGVPAPERA